MVFSFVGAVLLAVKAGAPTMNTITFLPGSTSHRSYCCLQGLEQTSKATVWFCIPVRALQPLELPPWWKAQPHSLPQASLMIFQRHTQGLVTQCIIVGESSETHEASSMSFGRGSHTFCPSPSSWCKCTPRMGREPEPQITALCASMTAWLAAPHKILFTAHTGEKLQQQSSPEGGKSADLATLRERPEGGSGTIIIILLPLIHCRYLYCSHSLWGIQPLVTTGYWCIRGWLRGSKGGLAFINLALRIVTPLSTSPLLAD